MQSTAPTAPLINFNGAVFNYLHTRRDRSLYRGDSAYLRIGPREVVEQERRNHERLFRLNFPVPFLLDEGEYEGSWYTLEESAGEETFDAMFARQIAARGEPGESTLRAATWLVIRYAEAQLAAPVGQGMPENLSGMLGLPAVLDGLPDLREQTLAAVERLAAGLEVFPTVYSHGGFGPHNLCPRGVIDLEQVEPAPAGYDLLSWLFLARLAPPGRANHQWPDAAQVRYVSAVDNLFTTRGLAPPSAYADQFLLCKLMAMVSSKYAAPAVQLWAAAAYREHLLAFLCR